MISFILCTLLKRTTAVAKIVLINSLHLLVWVLFISMFTSVNHPSVYMYLYYRTVQSLSPVISHTFITLINVRYCEVYLPNQDLNNFLFESFLGVLSRMLSWTHSFLLIDLLFPLFLSSY